MRQRLCSLEVYLDRTWLTNETWRGCVQRCKKVGNRCRIAGGKLTESFYLRVEYNFILWTCSEAETKKIPERCCVLERRRRWLVVVKQAEMLAPNILTKKHGSVGFASYDKTNKVRQNDDVEWNGTGTDRSQHHIKHPLRAEKSSTNMVSKAESKFWKDLGLTLKVTRKQT